MGLRNFFLFPWDVVKFIVSAVVLIGTVVLANLLLILAIVLLFSLAENQTVLFSSAGGLGNTLSSASNYGRSIISIVSNCLLDPKLAWNHLFEFIFAMVRVATAGNHVAFQNFPFSTRDAYPPDSRFVVIDIICTVLIPMFETAINVALVVGNFFLELFREFVALVTQAGGINFTFMELFVGLIVNPLMDFFDPGQCMHPFSGPLGWPGAPLHCMGCTLSRPAMNQDSTTKTNALFVCYCGGDLHDTAYNNVIGCLHLSTVIDFFISLGKTLVGVANMIGNLETYKNAANVVWNGIQSLWSEIESLFNKVKTAVCKIPFVCKILKIRSIIHRGIVRDDPYICSYDTRIPGGDPDPFCFYESEFAIPQLSNHTDAAAAISVAWNRVLAQINALDMSRMQALMPTPPPPVNATRQRMYRERFEVEQEEDNDGISAILETMKILRIFVSTGIQAIHSGRNVGPEHILQRFREEDVQPHHIPLGVRRYAVRAGLRPVTLPWTSPVPRIDHERMHANGSPTVRFSPPPPINFFGAILSTGVSISWHGITNASGLITAIVQTLAAVGLAVVSIVVKLAIGLLNSIFPSPLITGYTFNPLTDLISIFSPVYAQAKIGPVAASVFTNAWDDFSTVFNNVISSRLGVEIVHYMFTIGSYMLLDPANTPPYHPEIGSVNEMLTVVFNCNPQAACFIPFNCNYGPCDCGNGTIITLEGFCAAPGRCKCFPLFNTNANAQPDTISLSVDIDPAAAGYVPINVMWPYTNVGQGLWNCILDAWNGALPYLASLLIHNAVNVSILSVALHYTVGWCKCCSGITSFLMKLTLVMGPLGAAVHAAIFPAMTYCTPRDVWYCNAFLHFFRPTPPSFTDFLLFWLNFAPSTTGLLLMAGMVLVPMFAAWMLLGALALVGVDVFDIATYGVQHDWSTKGSRIKDE